MQKFNKCCKCFDFSSKAIGLSCFTFCVGILAGMCLPIAVVALLEAVLILIMGYLCLFRW